MSHGPQQQMTQLLEAECESGWGIAPVTAPSPSALPKSRDEDEVAPPWNLLDLLLLSGSHAQLLPERTLAWKL